MQLTYVYVYIYIHIYICILDNVCCLQLPQKRHSSDDNPEIAKRLRSIKALSEVIYKNAGQNIIKAQAHQKRIMIGVMQSPCSKREMLS